MTDYQLIQSIIQCGVNDDLEGAKKVLADYVFDEIRYFDSFSVHYQITQQLGFGNLFPASNKEIYDKYLQQKTPEHS